MAVSADRRADQGPPEAVALIDGQPGGPNGMEFTDANGRQLTGCGRPATPGAITVSGNWTHPSVERLDSRWVHFNDPRPAA